MEEVPPLKGRTALGDWTDNLAQLNHCWVFWPLIGSFSHPWCSSSLSRNNPPGYSYACPRDRLYSWNVFSLSKANFSSRLYSCRCFSQYCANRWKSPDSLIFAVFVSVFYELNDFYTFISLSLAHPPLPLAGILLSSTGLCVLIPVRKTISHLWTFCLQRCRTKIFLERPFNPP